MLLLLYQLYDVEFHIDWVTNMENVLLLNGIDIHKKFFKCIVGNDLNLYNQLKSELNNKYNTNFNLNNDLFHFPNFIEIGKFEDMKFKYNDNLD